MLLSVKEFHFSKTQKSLSNTFECDFTHFLREMAAFHTVSLGGGGGNVEKRKKGEKELLLWEQDHINGASHRNTRRKTPERLPFSCPVHQIFLTSKEGGKHFISLLFSLSLFLSDFWMTFAVIVPMEGNCGELFWNNTYSSIQEGKHIFPKKFIESMSGVSSLERIKKFSYVERYSATVMKCFLPESYRLIYTSFESHKRHRWWDQWSSSQEGNNTRPSARPPEIPVNWKMGMGIINFWSEINTPTREVYRNDFRGDIVRNLWFHTSTQAYTIHTRT